MIQRALFVVAGALAGYLLFGAFAAFGVAAVAVNLLTPLPAAYVGMRISGACGWLTVGLTALLVLLGGGGAAALMYFIQFGLPAGVLCILLRRQVSWDRAVFATLGVIVGAGLIGLVLAAAFQGVNPLTLAGATIDKEISQTAGLMQEFFAEADLPRDEADEINEALRRMTDFMRDVYAGLTITVSYFMLLALVLLLSLFAQGRYTVPGSPFQQWKAPEPLIWVLIAAGFAALFVEGVVKTFAMNLLVVLLPIYFVQGLAIIDSFFRRKALSPLIRTIGYLLVVLVNPLPLLVTFVGVFDLWVDFRKPRITNS